eukprot:COSAG01_NODE_45466_length_409_cov_0.835484_1_plen_136_part_11
MELGARSLEAAKIVRVLQAASMGAIDALTEQERRAVEIEQEMHTTWAKEESILGPKEYAQAQWKRKHRSIVSTQRYNGHFSSRGRSEVRHSVTPPRKDDVPGSSTKGNLSFIRARARKSKYRASRYTARSHIMRHN